MKNIYMLILIVFIEAFLSLVMGWGTVLLYIKIPGVSPFAAISASYVMAGASGFLVWLSFNVKVVFNARDQ